MIKQIESIVEEACKKDTNIFGYGIWTHHIKQVVKNAKIIAPIFNADIEIVEIAALLHDYASVKDKSLYKEHHIHSQHEAERILLDFNCSPSKIDAIKYCIFAHRGSVPMDKLTPEAGCLANADAITHIQEVPSLLYASFIKKNMRIDEGTEWVRKKLERSWKKLNPIVQDMIREKYEAAIKVLSK
jgi:uncharacterized protein